MQVRVYNILFKIMFIFLIALKSQAASNDWQKASSLLAQTLASIANQTNGNFKTVVVCNEKTLVDNSTVDWVITDIESPNINTSFREKEKDRAAKLKIGFDYAQKYSPSYFMPVDADDFVNRTIVDFVLDNEPSEGYYLEQGYIYEQGEQIIYIDKGFKEYCGTSLIIKNQAFLDYLKADTYLHNQYTKLDELPFTGAIYDRCNGENFAATTPLKQAMGSSDPRFSYQPITSLLKQTFTFVHK